MNKPQCIRFSSLISDPEAYITEMFQLHPDAKHDMESGAIEIKNEIIDSSFKYSLIDEGLFLFSFSSFSPVDAEYEFIPNPNAPYFTLVFYFTASRTKKPIYLKANDQFHSSDQISLFFNGNMTAEFFIKARQKAYGLRLDIHKDWIKKNVDTTLLKKDSLLNDIFEFRKKGYIQIHCQLYEGLVKDILSAFEKEASILQKLNLKAQSFHLIAKYLKELSIVKKNIKTEVTTLQNTGELQFALNYLEKNLYNEFPGNNYLAELCNISTSSFSKKFKTSFNVSPAVYFKNLKMKEAFRLLLLGENVKQVAYKTGYKDPSAFGRSFKQYYGQSPAMHVKK